MFDDIIARVPKLSSSPSNGYWPKDIVHWTDSQTAYISVPFTWLLPQAFSRCVWYQQQGYHVRAGGPAVSLLPNYLASVAEIGGDIPALAKHAPNATFTTRGCIRRCEFCAVPKIEGDFRELTDWEAKPIVCDNNLTVASRKHWETVIERLKPLKGIDFNQGLDARLLKDWHIEGLQQLKLACVRFAWDHISLEKVVFEAIMRCLKGGIPKSNIRVYVLFGFNDTPEDALYRCETLKRWGITKPNVQRFQPLDCLKKDNYVHPNWTERKLRDFTRYWSRQNWLSKIPFSEYAP